MQFLAQGEQSEHAQRCSYESWSWPRRRSVTCLPSSPYHVPSAGWRAALHCWKAPNRQAWVERETLAKGNHEAGQPDDQYQWQDQGIRLFLLLEFSSSISLQDSLLLTYASWLDVSSWSALRPSPLLPLPCYISQGPGGKAFSSLACPVASG